VETELGTFIHTSLKPELDDQRLRQLIGWLAKPADGSGL